ncbi:DegQ family serine endoprotease [Candidatus Entotheonella palauensis]|uniref:DegQ family serine endoprotease n=1 Tax=Candidatus Entotheonella palauensis TaxID=93172 RepID=UPI000B7E33A5|nr:DegQ family serine endoprotease [Candidatus Entotheonella palauensis]
MCRGISVHRGLNPWLLSVCAALWLALSALAFPVDAEAQPFWQQGRQNPLSTQPAPPNFTELAKALQPAVVNISTKQQEVRPSEDSPMEFFERFFGGPGRRRRRRPGQGSGFIISQDGYIVTNYHVIEDAADIKVTLTTRQQFNAKLIGGDAKTDLALLKIEADEQLPTVPAGNSDQLEVGEWVMAIGNPFGLGHTVTTGIVSAKGRTIGAGPYDDFIQTDASINPGNSGGPLFNMRGEVIGINTAIVPQGQGIGFAIPSNMALNILRQLSGEGKVTRGWLGVAIQQLSPELMQAFKLENNNGALIADVIADSPAKKAGLKRGDIIVGFNGEKVQESSELPRLVATMPPGTSATVDIIREGKTLSVPVILGTLEEDDTQAVAKAKPSDVEVSLGLRVEPITPDIATSLKLENTDGVVVSGVDANGPAAEAGLRRGDVVREINRLPISDLDDYETITSNLRTDTTVLLLVERRGSNLYVALKPEEAG